MWDRYDPREIDTRERPSPGRGAGTVDPRDVAARDPRDMFTAGLDLPRGLERERVFVHDDTYQLRGSEVRTLAIVGAFRAVPVDDLRDDRGRPEDRWHGDLDRLRDARLIRSVAPLDRETGTNIVTLTERGRKLLETHRSRDYEHVQTFYAGLGRLRELSHDAQLYRAYLRTAERLVDRGASIRRVMLDHELKREYQRFLQERNRHRRESDGRPSRTSDEVREWAHAHGLPILDGRVQFPDLRVEYDWTDRRLEVEDVEITTPHYRGAHAAAKARAGFTRYRSAGARVGGAGGRRGGGRAPDPRLAEELLR